MNNFLMDGSGGMAWSAGLCGQHTAPISQVQLQRFAVPPLLCFTLVLLLLLFPFFFFFFFCSALLSFFFLFLLLFFSLLFTFRVSLLTFSIHPFLPSAYSLFVILVTPFPLIPFLSSFQSFFPSSHSCHLFRFFSFLYLTFFTKLFCVNIIYCLSRSSFDIDKYHPQNYRNLFLFVLFYSILF